MRIYDGNPNIRRIPQIIHFNMTFQFKLSSYWGKPVGEPTPVYSRIVLIKVHNRNEK